MPDHLAFATKPALAKAMIAAAVEHTPGAWVARDEVYGRNPHLRAFLEERRVGYAIAVAATDRLPTPRGPVALRKLAVLLPSEVWQKLSAAAWAKDERFYDWALIDDHADGAGMR